MKSNSLIVLGRLWMKLYENEQWNDESRVDRVIVYFPKGLLCCISLVCDVTTCGIRWGKTTWELLPSFEVIRWFEFTINRRNSLNLDQSPKLQYRFPVFSTIRSSSLWNIMLDRTLYVGLVFWNMLKYYISLFWKEQNTGIHSIHSIEIFPNNINHIVFCKRINMCFSVLYLNQETFSVFLMNSINRSDFIATIIRISSY